MKDKLQNGVWRGEKMGVIIEILILVVMAACVVGMFFWADYKVKKRNKEEYKRTGIMLYGIYQIIKGIKM